jgi:CubicO group peptidase (beta-lactamase class C family)
MKYLIILFIFIGCRSHEKQINDSQSQAIHRLIQQYHNAGIFDGTVLVADSSGIVFKGAFGLADRENNIPLEVETMFYLASVSKQFTATAVLMLLKEKEIGLDEKIRRYLPDLPDIYEGITFRNLLNHTSGIPDYYNFAELHDGFTNDDVLNALLSVDRLEFLPGSKYAYSNSGYVLLSILVSRISDRSFSQYLKENVFEKAGMESTVVFDENAAPMINRAIGYSQDSSITDYRFRTTGGGGIFSNVGDLYRWHKALSHSSVLPSAVLQPAYEPAVLNNDSTVYYGFGWNIDPADPTHVYHAGELEGFRTFFDRSLENDRAIILLSNNSCDRLQDMADKLSSILTGDIPGASEAY